MNIEIIAIVMGQITFLYKKEKRDWLIIWYTKISMISAFINYSEILTSSAKHRSLILVEPSTFLVSIVSGESDLKGASGHHFHEIIAGRHVLWILYWTMDISNTLGGEEEKNVKSISLSSQSMYTVDY